MTPNFKYGAQEIPSDKLGERQRPERITINAEEIEN
jgi:hypothetical protein